MNILEVISQPWHWAFSGFMIVVVMYWLLWLGEQFGVSSNLRTLCSMSGIGRNIDYFKINWRQQSWNLLFILGAVIGGFIASQYLKSDEPVQITQKTQQYLQSFGISTPQTLAEGQGFVPSELFVWTNAIKLKNFVFLIIGGFFIGFGARYAGGCTSGHAISGLSNLQLPSLISVIAFFIGGLFMTWYILPYLLS